MTKLILLHAVVVLHYTQHKKNWHDWSGDGGGCQNAQKLFIIKILDAFLYKPVA